MRELTSEPDSTGGESKKEQIFAYKKKVPIQNYLFTNLVN
jgi:hypothetical protein